MYVDATVESLLADLNEAIGLLSRAGETHWQGWLERGRDQVARGDAHGLDHLLRAIGGMGSFNDLVLSQPSANQTAESLRRADDRLCVLRDSIWRKCHDLQRELTD